MNKSIYQVAAVLGTLYAGCIYVPIVADQEIERAKKILEITNANIVLTTVAENSEYMSGKAIIEVDALSDIKFETELPEYGLEDVAYIIFTSGSTGEPKGVTITHAAAVNTIEDINNKNKVTCDDSVLGLSKLKNYLDSTFIGMQNRTDVLGRNILFNTVSCFNYTNASKK